MMRVEGHTSEPDTGPVVPQGSDSDKTLDKKGEWNFIMWMSLRNRLNMFSCTLHESIRDATGWALQPSRNPADGFSMHEAANRTRQDGLRWNNPPFMKRKGVCSVSETFHVASQNKQQTWWEENNDLLLKSLIEWKWDWTQTVQLFASGHHLIGSLLLRLSSSLFFFMIHSP